MDFTLFLYEQATDPIVISYASTLCSLANISKVEVTQKLDGRDALWINGNPAYYAGAHRCAAVRNHNKGCRKNKYNPIDYGFTTTHGPASALFAAISEDISCQVFMFSFTSTNSPNRK